MAIYYVYFVLQDEKVSGEEDGPVDVQNEEETEATNDIDAEAEKADDG